MPKQDRQYITTAIDYPNAPPHMGHVFGVKGKPAVFLSRALLSLSGIAPGRQSLPSR